MQDGRYYPSRVSPPMNAVYLATHGCGRAGKTTSEIRYINYRDDDTVYIRKLPRQPQILTVPW